jgi:excisionase family DNA binding protein
MARSDALLLAAVHGGPYDAIKAKLDQIDRLTREVLADLVAAEAAKSAESPAVRTLLTMQEAADALRVSLSMIKKLTRPGCGLATTRIGDRVLIPMASLNEFIAARTSQSA